MKCIAKSQIRLLVNGERITVLKGKIFDVEDGEAARLAILKAAEIIGESVEDDNESSDGYMDEASLKALNKGAICDYAASIGMEVDASLKKEDLINKILDHIEEIRDLGEAGK